MMNTSAALHSPPIPGGGQQRPYLHVTQLSPQINESSLREIFSAAGNVVSTKVVISHQGGYNYGFVEYADLRSAETALQTLNGRKFFDNDIRIEWATGGHAQQGMAASGGAAIFAGAGPASTPVMHGGMPMMAMDTQMSSPTAVKENTQSHSHVFVGDLSPEVNDAALRQAFLKFASLSEARVMWDVSSGKSRGYGFVAFRDKLDAEQAIATMNGEWLGSRAIRVNWANQKVQSSNTPGQHTGHGGMMGPGRSMSVAAALGGMGAIGLGASSMPPMGGAASGTPITYEQALAGSPPHNTTVYVGNIPPFATQNDLIPLFSHYGYIVEIRMQAERGFAFVKLDTHENAANAIVNLAGQIACGRPIKCGWGKDRNESAMLGALRQGMQLSGYGSVTMYGMPQYGFPGGFASAGQMTAALDAATIQQIQAAQAQAVHQAMQQQQHQSQHQQQQQLSAAASQQPISPQNLHQPQQLQSHQAQPQTHQNVTQQSLHYAHQGMPGFPNQGS